MKLETESIAEERPQVASIAALLASPPRAQMALLLAWLGTLGASIALGLASIIFHWSGLPLSFGGTAVHVTLYPPLIFATLWVIWFGFWWGFVPAYLATLTLSLYAGMPFGWALLFSFADPIGLVVFALGYHAIPVKPDLRSATSVSFFMLLAFVGGIFGSAGSFIWTYTVGSPGSELLAIWQGWWLGAFAQDVLFVAPLLLLFTPALCRWRNRQPWTVATRRPTNRSVVMAGAVTLGGVLFYLHATVTLSRLHLQELLAGIDPVQWRRAALGMADSADALYWVLLVVTLFLGIFGYQVFHHWTRALHATAVRLTNTNAELRREIAERKRAENELKVYSNRLAQANDRLGELARTDDLTGLFNRRYFMERATGELLRTQRHQRPVALLLLDLDHFKDINDTHGHAVGDAALRAVGGAISATLRQADLAGRYGGEEFVILLPETALTEASGVAERLRAAIAAAEIASDTGPCRVTASIGVAVGGDDQPDLDALLRRADAALYQAKHAGRDRVIVSTPT